MKTPSAALVATLACICTAPTSIWDALRQCYTQLADGAQRATSIAREHAVRRASA